MASLKQRARSARCWAVILFLLLTALLTGCEAKSQEEAASSAPPPPEVDVVEIITQPVVLSESFTGRVEAAETVDLRPRVSGYIQEVAFEEGELVEQAAFASHALLSNGVSNSLNIELGGDAERQFTGTLDFIDNRLNPNTGTLQFRAVLANPDGRIRPGEFARVNMPVARIEQAVLVDSKAVLTNQDRRYVYVVDENNLTEQRQVTTGRQVAERTVITDGLQPGNRVIVNGVQKVFFPGMEVSPQSVAAAPAADAPISDDQPTIAAREE